MHTNRFGNTHEQKCHAKGSRKETKIQEFMYRGTMNVEHEMYDYTGKNCSQATRIVRKVLNKNLEVIPEKHSIDAPQKTAILRT